MVFEKSHEYSTDPVRMECMVAALPLHDSASRHVHAMRTSFLVAVLRTPPWLLTSCTNVPCPRTRRRINSSFHPYFCRQLHGNNDSSTGGTRKRSSTNKAPNIANALHNELFDSTSDTQKVDTNAAGAGGTVDHEHQEATAHGPNAPPMRPPSHEDTLISSSDTASSASEAEQEAFDAEAIQEAIQLNNETIDSDAMVAQV